MAVAVEWMEDVDSSKEKRETLVGGGILSAFGLAMEWVEHGRKMEHGDTIRCE